jgi:hypothetical protein
VTSEQQPKTTKQTNQVSGGEIHARSFGQRHRPVKRRFLERNPSQISGKK